MIFTVAFWKAAFERSIKTAAQAAILVIGADQLNVFNVDVANVLGFALGGAVLSLLTSVGSDFVGTNGPSLANEETKHV